MVYCYGPIDISVEPEYLTNYLRNTFGSRFQLNCKIAKLLGPSDNSVSELTTT